MTWFKCIGRRENKNVKFFVTSVTRNRVHFMSTVHFQKEKGEETRGSWVGRHSGINSQKCTFKKRLECYFFCKTALHTSSIYRQSFIFWLLTKDKSLVILIQRGPFLPFLDSPLPCINPMHWSRDVGYDTKRDSFSVV